MPGQEGHSSACQEKDQHDHKGDEEVHGEAERCAAPSPLNASLPSNPAAMLCRMRSGRARAAEEDEGVQNIQDPHRERTVGKAFGTDSRPM